MVIKQSGSFFAIATRGPSAARMGELDVGGWTAAWRSGQLVSRGQRWGGWAAADVRGPRKRSPRKGAQCRAIRLSAAW